jgi:selenide,water dikinase
MEMLGASGMSAVLRLEAIPALPGARALASHGIESTLAPENRRLLGNIGDKPDIALLADPQTSGGLLLGVPDGRADACLQALLDEGLTAAIIGDVEAAGNGPGRIRLE